MLLIYTHKITNRLTYVGKHLFTGILGIEVSFTSKVEDFIKHTGPKLTYTKKPLQNEFFIRSNDLLFEKGINDIQISISNWNDVPCFFACDETSSVPYDVFSASFFMLSRYEEYLPHVKDRLGRFPAKESIGFKSGFLHLPVVDLWAYKLLELLKVRFPEIKALPKPYRFTPMVNVTVSHKYARRGFSRALGGYLLDLSRLRLKSLVKRTAVQLGMQKDPYDNFEHLLALHEKYRAKPLFFFQFAAYGEHDKNISPNNLKFGYLIKAVADRAVVSLSTSFESSTNLEVLKKEKKRLGELIHRPIHFARLRYNRVNVPTTYRTLIEAEFTSDFSMGYTHQIGFRAGTCTPFPFYDIGVEAKQPLRVHPFVMHDYALQKFKKSDKVFEKLDPIFESVRKLHGELNLVFSNELLGTQKRLDWLKLYEALLKRYYV